MSIESLESKILDLENELMSIRHSIKFYKDKLLSVESNLISVKLQKESALEELKILKNTLDYNLPTDRELDIERFKIAHLDIIKKI